MQVIARIHTDFEEKFGIPRQAGLVKQLRGTIVFEPKFRDPNALRSLEDFSHIWLLWLFENEDEPQNWHPMVRPPRLGGNDRIGVFATRSPYRPNPIGLSAVKIESIEQTEQGPLIHVLGADLKNNTAIIDIKPYVPLADCIEDASGGFTDTKPWPCLKVSIKDTCEENLNTLSQAQREALVGALQQDPRPAIDRGTAKDYALSYAGLNIRFTVNDETKTLEVFAID